MRLTVAISFLALLVAGCAGEQGMAPESQVVQKVRFVAPAEAAPSAAPGAAAPVEVPARKLVRTVDLDLRVEDPDATTDAVKRLTKATGGYISEIDAYRVDELLHYRLSIRIPVDELDQVLDQLKALAVKVESEHLCTEDVTEQFVDLEAQVRTLQLTEQELQALLAEARSRGSKADDIMTIYGYLTEIRTNIERIQGRLNAIDSLATYSTVNLQLAPTEAARPLVADRWRPSVIVRDSIRMLLSGLEGLANALIVLIIVVAPILLLLGAAVWAVLKGWKRVRRGR